LEKYIILESYWLCVSISIKDVDESAFRNLKAEAVRRGMRIGDAATEAFRAWVASQRQMRVRDRERMLAAARDMDALRESSGVGWSGAEEIRKWRDERKR
jgi:hypothetical protein